MKKQILNLAGFSPKSKIQTDLRYIKGGDLIGSEDELSGYIATHDELES